MKRSAVETYNLVSIGFAVLTVLAFLCILLLLLRVVAPPAFLRAAVVSTPTLVVPPTDTITPTPSNTPIPSPTPLPSATPTKVPPSATATTLPPTVAPATSTPSQLPTATPTITQTPTNTSVPTKAVTPSKTPKGFVASPTKAALLIPPTSAFPFSVQSGFPSAAANPDINTGCKYEGLAGQVYSLDQQPITQNIKISVAGPKGVGVQTAPSPANDVLYSPGSWVFPVDDKPSTAAFTVQVVDIKGRALSDKVPIKFENSCDKNVIFVNFVQTRTIDLLK